MVTHVMKDRRRPRRDSQLWERLGPGQQAPAAGRGPIFPTRLTMWAWPSSAVLKLNHVHRPRSARMLAWRRSGMGWTMDALILGSL
jgi:hypothetical protein